MEKCRFYQHAVSQKKDRNKIKFLHGIFTLCWWVAAFLGFFNNLIKTGIFVNLKNHDFWRYFSFVLIVLTMIFYAIYQITIAYYLRKQKVPESDFVHKNYLIFINKIRRIDFKYLLITVISLSIFIAASLLLSSVFSALSIDMEKSKTFFAIQITLAIIFWITFFYSIARPILIINKLCKNSVFGSVIQARIDEINAENIVDVSSENEDMNMDSDAKN